jgi:hypothetical protein
MKTFSTVVERLTANSTQVLLTGTLSDKITLWVRLIVDVN